MGVYCVHQGETYKQECRGGYLWSPKLNKMGRKNRGYTTMTAVKKNDFIS